MSDKTGASRPSRSGSGAILSGLAVGAILSTPVAAVAAVTAAAGPSAVAGTVAAVGAQAQQVAGSETPVTAIREQFRDSFIAGAVIPPATDLLAIICDPS